MGRGNDRGRSQNLARRTTVSALFFESCFPDIFPAGLFSASLPLLSLAFRRFCSVAGYPVIAGNVRHLGVVRWQEVSGHD